MKRALRLIVLVPVAILLVLLAIANRHAVTFSLDPFGPADPAWSATVPLFWIIFAALALGILAGGIATWWRQGRWRKVARHDHAEVERLRREVRDRAAALAAPSAGTPGNGRMT